jgi:hypothetical protein
MLDRHILALQNRSLARPAARPALLGVSADAVTIVGFCVGLPSRMPPPSAWACEASHRPITTLRRLRWIFRCPG